MTLTENTSAFDVEGLQYYSYGYGDTDYDYPDYEDLYFEESNLSVNVGWTGRNPLCGNVWGDFNWSSSDTSIVSVDETTGQIINWCTSGALTDFDGEYNTSFIRSGQLEKPAGTYSSKDSKGMSGWYLPSVGELALLYTLQNSGVINSDKQNFKDFEHFGYWSSSECGENETWYVNFYSGIVTGNSKISSYNVRSVIRF